MAAPSIAAGRRGAPPPPFFLAFQRKSETAYWIGRKGNTKFADTAGERGFVACMGAAGVAVVQPLPVDVKLTDYVVKRMREIGHPLWERGPEDWLTLAPDHYMPELGVWGYTDGPRHWTDTVRRKDRRLRDLLWLYTGQRVFSVDTDYLEDPSWWPEVHSRLAGFLMRGDVPVWGLER